MVRPSLNQIRRNPKRLKRLKMEPLVAMREKRLALRPSCHRSLRAHSRRRKRVLKRRR